jgi:putative CocE/NonD family hydrolase
MPDLARAAIAIYRDDDRRKYLDTLFRLQIVAGQHAQANKSLEDLRALPASTISPQPGATLVLYEILARARARQRADGTPFDEAFRQAFRNAIGRLDDRTSALALRSLGVYRWVLEQSVKDSLEKHKGKSVISLPDAVELIKAYQVEQAFRTFTPLVAPLIAEDDQRRYTIDQDVRVRTTDGASLCAIVFRPRAGSARLATLLQFTIYAEAKDNLNEARRSASHGYAGVVGLTRGKGCSPDQPVPYLHDGSDAAALIDWIGAQEWSDGRVGMYGGSYNGFTPWAAAKHGPKALKAIMVGAPAAPGIDVPMEGNVFWNFVYPWPFYTTNDKALDDATYNDSARWNRLNHDWYVSGRAYRDLDKIDGTPNPVFDEWVAHPTYDAYWQGLIPYKKEFARINIPVLITAGYYSGGPGAAVYYTTQHYKYHPRAEHYLLIGPYDHVQGQRGTVGLLGGTTTVLAGYELDPVAQIDMFELRYQWFDYALRGGPKPDLLKDKVNYQVTGANVWKHSPSLAAMANQVLKFHLSPARSGDAYRLSDHKPARDAFITQTVDLADRSDVDRSSPGGGVLDKALDTWNGLQFVSEPLTKPTELSGLFSGRLDLVANKKDFDFQISLYELTTKGEYVELAPFWARASHVNDLSHRRLLTPGKRQRLDFQSRRLMSRQLQTGSRLVAVLSVIREPGRQINYGTGKNVSDETIADAKPPLMIRWFSDSYIQVPVRR